MANHLARVGRDAVQVLCDELNQLYLQVNRPKYTELEKISAELKTKTPGVRFLSKSSINDTVRGKRSKLPDWQWVFSFVTVCQVYATRNKLPCVDQLAEIAYWNDRWHKAERACVDTAPLSVTEETAPVDEAIVQSGAIPPPSDSKVLSPSAIEEPTRSGFADNPSKRLEGVIGSLTAKRYRDLFGEHGVELLHAAENHRDLDSCCRIGVLLIGVGCTHEGEAWLSIAERNDGDPGAAALLRFSDRQQHKTREKQSQFAAELLYEMAVDGDYRRMKTKDTSSNNWIELYLRISALCCGHKDAAYRLAIRSRALGNDTAAAGWFTLAARNGHHIAPERLETISEEIWDEARREERP